MSAVLVVGCVPSKSGNFTLINMIMQDCCEDSVYEQAESAARAFLGKHFGRKTPYKGVIQWVVEEK